MNTSNRLGELIELARKSFNEDTGRRFNSLFDKSYNENNYLYPKPGKLRRPHSLYEFSTTEKMNDVFPGFTTDSRRKNSTTSERDDSVNSEKSAWYREIYKLCHQLQPDTSGRLIF